MGAHRQKIVKNVGLKERSTSARQRPVEMIKKQAKATPEAKANLHTHKKSLFTEKQKRGAVWETQCEIDTFHRSVRRNAPKATPTTGKRTSHG